MPSEQLPPPPQTRDLQTQPGPLKGERVLLIEDSQDARVLYRRSLQQSGAVVFAVSSGAEANQALREFRPTLIVSDIGLPHENGLVFIRKLRASEQAAISETAHSNQTKRIPALAVTAFDDFYDEAKRAGFDACLSKPVTGAKVVSQLCSLKLTKR